MNSSPITQVVTFNNHAVVQIRNGEYASAISTLSQALQCSKTLIASCNNSSLPKRRLHAETMSTMRTRQPMVVAHFSSEVELSSCSSSSSSSSMNMSSNDDGDDSLYLCKRPLEVQIIAKTASAATICPASQDADTLSYSVIYNLALCYHFQGIVLVSSSPRGGIHYQSGQRSLQRAASLYSHARKLLINNGANGAGTPELGTMQSLVLFNNMSHAYQLLGDTPTTMKTLHLLVKAIMRISTTGTSTTAATTTATNAAGPCCADFPLDGFLSNISLLLGSSTTAPAA